MAIVKVFIKSHVPHNMLLTFTASFRSSDQRYFNGVSANCSSGTRDVLVHYSVQYVKLPCSQFIHLMTLVLLPLQQENSFCNKCSH